MEQNSLEPDYNAIVCEAELLEPLILNRPILNNSRFGWIIDYADVFDEGNLCSHTFCSEENDAFAWRVEIFLSKNFFDDKKKDFNISIFNTKSGKSSMTQYKYCVLSANGKEAYTKTVVRRKTSASVIFMAISDLNGYVVSPDNRLNLMFEVIAYGEPVQLEPENLGSLFESCEFSDITLVASEKEIRAHKVILAAQSTVFSRMFKNDMIESKKNRVEINDVEPEVLEEMLRFVYSGQTSKLDEMALDLLAAANKYDLQTLKVACEDAIWKNITFANAVDVLFQADLHQTEKLKKKVLDFIVKNFERVKETKSYNTMVQSHPSLSSELAERMYALLKEKTHM